VIQKKISDASNVDAETALTEAKNTVAATLGISAENIDEDYLKVKNPASLAAASQISSVLTVVSSSTGGAGDASSNEAALDSFAKLLTDSSGAVDLTQSSSIETILETAALTTGTSIDASAVENVAQITVSVVSTIQAIDTTSTDTSTFAELETITYAATTLGDAIEASGVDVSVNVTQSVADASGTVDTDNIFEPTQSEKGIKKLQDLNIAQSIINDISAISLSSDGSTVVGSHIDFSSIDTSSNVLIARNAMMDIIFGNDPSAVSFVSTKANLGIILDSTDTSFFTP
jgi:hypothetical protein